MRAARPTAPVIETASSPCKVLHILDHSLPLHSGYTFRSQNLFEAQRRMGFAPVVLTGPKHEQSWKGEWAPVERINGYRYYRTGPVPSNGPPMLPEIRLIRSLGRRIGRVIEEERPDILHAHSPFLNALAALEPARRTGIPLVYEIRAFWEDAAVDHGSYGQGSWKYRLVRDMETRVCRRADHVTVLCHGIRDDLVRRGIPGGKITPIFNGIDPEAFRPAPPDELLRRRWGLEGRTVVGFIGSFYRYEGLDLLIEAFARLAPSRPHLALVLVGGGEMKE
jgi:PEP-CTERM/exosortase A-associated glycosyltransferase